MTSGPCQARRHPDICRSNCQQDTQNRPTRTIEGDLQPLELSESKTLITHGRTEAARFLGYEVTVQESARPTGESPSWDRNTGTPEV